MNEVDGVTQPEVLNLYSIEKVLNKRKNQPSTSELVSGILAHDIATLSRAITLIESTNTTHLSKANEVIKECLPYANKSIRIGITGVPGVGKSTFIEAFGKLMTSMGRKVAVLAVDPSSSISHGSILGDKTRMEELSVAKNAFIRPSPSAGSLGGVARKTRESIVLCEAAGFDVVFVETVGVGQSETAVHSMVDFFLLIQLAGTGDELQGIKRGIMEMADGIAINKCDGTNIEKSQLARRQYLNALHLFPLPESGWKPEVITCSAIERTGIAEVWQMVQNYVDFVNGNGYLDRKRTDQSKYWMYETINEQLKSNFYNNEKIQALLQVAENEVLSDKISSFVAARQLLDAYREMNW